MRYAALATDYDGTIAHHGHVEAATLAALSRVRESGRKLLLVTGRELPDLLHVFPEAGIFDLIVAENGAFLYYPISNEIRMLAQPPPRSFSELLLVRGVSQLSVGRVIVATQEQYEPVVRQAIEELGLELQIILNKGSVMVLPRGVDKASGLRAGLGELAISPDAVVGVGDAENDQVFLDLCGCSVAVGNALQSVKDRATFTTASGHGTGVCELIDQLISSDLSEAGTLRRRDSPVGLGLSVTRHSRRPRRN
ncbi:MAG: Cof-type HAD-IIB family hydrolase [Verrucomicrobiales bacterium]|nr:Cof-type HAD-IIB family hydrolase [Verrucomicrobiales bacterium]